MSQPELALLKRIVGRLPVLVFGSRAKGTHRKFSDLDLCLDCEKPLPPARLGEIKEQFQKSDLPYRVDLVQGPQLTREFAKVVAADGVPLKSARPGQPHPWRLCPLGAHWVKPHLREKARGPVPVTGHCRRNPSGKDSIFSDELREISRGGFPGTKKLPCPKLGKYARASVYDTLIGGWTQYWNEVLAVEPPLDPNLVKALIATESSFLAKPKEPVARGSGRARGPLQITDQAIRVLGAPKGELKDHLVHLTREDARDPEVAIPAGIRWLFHKRVLAGRRLGRTASWEESVAEYKSYLKDLVTRRGARTKVAKERMKAFGEIYAQLNHCGG